MKGKEDISIVVFAGCDWWYHNRGLFCCQTMSRLARSHKLLFVNSLATRFPSLKTDRHAVSKILRKLRSLARFLRKSDNGMYVLTPFSLPFFEKPIVGSLMIMLTRLQIRMVMALLSISRPVIIVACPPAWRIAQKVPHRYLVYQRTDFYEEMPGANKDFLQQCDHELMTHADLVLYVNAGLCREGMKKNRNSLLVGHGVDYSLFASACTSEAIPEDIAAIPRPRIGFYGDISDDVCDFALLEHIARTLPSASIVLVGAVSSDVQRLRDISNIHFLGQKPYQEIPHYGKAFDVAIMPWKQNKWIEFCNPVKTKEYLAQGKPIVSTDYPELEPYHHVVYPAQNYDEFVEQLKKALRENDPSLQEKRRRLVENETWDDKSKMILDTIHQGLQAKGYVNLLDRCS